MGNVKTVKMGTMMRATHKEENRHNTVNAIYNMFSNIISHRFAHSRNKINTYLN